MTDRPSKATSSHPLPHARSRLDAWAEAWRGSGGIVLLLDFDGTLAPIVERPEMAEIPARTRAALERLLPLEGVEAAIVSGRGLADARARAALGGIAYAGNHGMEIEGPGVARLHEPAAAARPELETVLSRLLPALEPIPGAFVEDKGLTLSIHYRRVDRGRVPDVRKLVARAAGSSDRLRVTEGKEVLEVRPRVDWHKGKAVEFLLRSLEPAPGLPVLYLGDDTTDEDAFRALAGWRGGSGEGVVVGDPPPETAARCFVADPTEVAELLEGLADRAPGG